jgi:hypothetical protein
MQLAGVQLLPAEAGVAWIRRELSSSPFRGEVVVAGELGLMAAGPDETGGLDVTAVPVEGCGPMIGAVTGMSVHDGLVVTTTLDPQEHPFLNHHRIDGTALLPGVMGMEGFAEVAALLAPGWRVAGLEEVAFTAPVKFYRDEPRTLTISALLHPDGDELLADCRLSAQRRLPGNDAPQTTVHFTGRVRLSRLPEGAPEPAQAVQDGAEPPQAVQDGAVQENGAPQLTPGDVYTLYFHGPAYQVVASAWRDGGDAVARLADGLHPDHRPQDGPFLIGPRLVELCFQDAGLWEAGNAGRLALPLRVHRLSLLARPGSAVPGPVYAMAHPEAGSSETGTTEAGNSEVGSSETGTTETGSSAGVFDCTVVDSAGRVLLRMDGYATVPLPAPVTAELGARLHEVMGPQPAQTWG